MSIFPATDLVTEVARAADPQRLKAAVTRLADLSPTKTHPEEFAALIDGTSSSKSASAVRQSNASPVARMESPSSTRTLQPAKASEVTEKFEAYILQTCLQTILPQSDHGLFGRGAAGGVWRSMVAEQIGNQIAKSGGVGLQKMLDGHLARLAARAASERT